MGGEEQYTWVIIKGPLGAIAMMVVPIDNQDLLQLVFFLRMARGHRDVVVKTKAILAIVRGMMPGRSDRAKGIP